MALFVWEHHARLGKHLRTVLHVRPGQSDQAIREEAIKAFRDLMQPCVEQNRDGAIEVGGEPSAEGVQYCLIKLLHENERVVGGAAFIARRQNLDGARDALNEITRRLAKSELG